MISLNKQFFLKQEKLDKANFYETIYKTTNNSNTVNTFNTDTFVNYDSNDLMKGELETREKLLGKAGL